MELVLGILLAGAVVVIVVQTARESGRAERGAAPPTGPVSFVADGVAVITLDLTVTDPAADAVQRIVDDAVTRAFAAIPDAAEIEVRDEAGTVLARRRRERPRNVSIPTELYEPHALRRAGPDPSAAHGWDEPMSAGAMPGVQKDLDPLTVPHRLLAERLDLPQAVASHLVESGGADDAVALVRALLEAGGHLVEGTGETMRVGSTCVVVIRAPIGEPVGAGPLNQAYLRYAESGASRGLVVSPGFMDPLEVRRREVLAPEVLHAGPVGIQRMADAVALGADPLRFAAAPPLSGG